MKRRVSHFKNVHGFLKIIWSIKNNNLSKSIKMPIELVIDIFTFQAEKFTAMYIHDFFNDENEK